MTRIEIKEESIRQDDEYENYLIIYVGTTKSEIHEQLKQQILNDYEIVNRLKVVYKIKDINKMCDCGCHSDLELIKWILGQDCILDKELQKILGEK